jgi:uncharacterized membrane protein YebE (DUF533 family)
MEKTERSIGERWYEIEDRRMGEALEEAAERYQAKKREEASLTLERAIEIAASAHRGQIDKAGRPYILHPIRVMLALDTEEEQIVGVLHDVVEDTPWTFEQLRAEGFSQVVLEALDSVTGREGEPYMDFAACAGRNEIGRRVKMADLRDNMDMSRIANPTEQDAKRIEKYAAALAMLEGMEVIA